jgi:hypothetical protein
MSPPVEMGRKRYQIVGYCATSPPHPTQSTRLSSRPGLPLRRSGPPPLSSSKNPSRRRSHPGLLIARGCLPGPCPPLSALLYLIYHHASSENDNPELLVRGCQLIADSDNSTRIYRRCFTRPKSLPTRCLSMSRPPRCNWSLFNA